MTEQGARELISLRNSSLAWLKLIRSWRGRRVKKQSWGLQCVVQKMTEIEAQSQTTPPISSAW